MREDKVRIPHLFSKVDNIHIHFLFFQALRQLDELQVRHVGTETGRCRWRSSVGQTFTRQTVSSLFNLRQSAQLAQNRRDSHLFHYPPQDSRQMQWSSSCGFFLVCVLGPAEEEKQQKHGNSTYWTFKQQLNEKHWTCHTHEPLWCLCRRRSFLWAEQRGVWTGCGLNLVSAWSGPRSYCVETKTSIHGYTSPETLVCPSFYLFCTLTVSWDTTCFTLISQASGLVIYTRFLFSNLSVERFYIQNHNHNP